jgi:subtilisin-like proprotein convertase family protein/uncharacterized protein YvpB
LSIPDNNPAGINITLAASEGGIITDMNLYLDISHDWVGDLSARITHNAGTATILDRPGYPASEWGCSSDDVVAIFDDRASQHAENQCSSYLAAISGTFQPNTPLDVFTGQEMIGDWTLNIADHYLNDTGTLDKWCLEITHSNVLPTASPTPTATVLPAQAIIPGMSGQDQSHPLDCEARAAVDWAAYFGHEIGEDEFQRSLPVSDDPDEGFVGSVYGQLGQLPPHDYGVHAGPVAERLRAYGLTAKDGRQWQWNDLRAEIAAGRPVIAWVVDDVSNGIPVYYTAANGHLTTVARYEHVVILVGYTETSVSVLNGAPPYDTYTLDQFLDSWSVLRNMAILARP